MADWIQRNLHQTATYWATTGSDGRGALGYSAPVAVKCRWRNQKKMLELPDGREIECKAKVFVDRTMTEGGYLFLGTSAETNPVNLGNSAFRIVWFDEVPDIHGLSFERTAYCA